MVETAKRTNCPACGAKITRQELSLCSYCGSPLGLIGDQPKAKDDATSQRLAKMRAHPEFEAAMARTPTQSGGPSFLPGVLLDVIGLALIAFAFSGRLTGSGGKVNAIPFGIGVALAIGGTMLIVRAARARPKVGSHPLLRRPAIVKDRRSNTTSRGGSAVTTYFFLLAFEEGGEAEFSFPGRGTSHELLVPGNTGIAYTRGDAILDFVRVRV